jgi:hypothetical protein
MPMKKTLSSCLSLAVAIGLLSGCARSPQQKPPAAEATEAASPANANAAPAATPATPAPSGATASPAAAPPLLSGAGYSAALDLDERHHMLRMFVEGPLSGAYGVHTNFLDTGQNAAEASGYEVLSESAGLLLRYYARMADRTAFDTTWRKTKEQLGLSGGFSYRYSPKLNKTYPVNAAIDDLRLIRALHEAYAQFGDKHYMEEARRYGRQFTAHNIKNGRLYDLYDSDYQTTNDFITLCYVDLKTLALLPLPTAEQDKLLTEMSGILEKGYLSDTFPFYETRYRYADKTYESDTIRTAESLVTILSLAEMGQERPESIRFLAEQVKEGTLYGAYTRTGEPINKVESTALYALAALIGSEVQDRTLYEASIQRMNAFQLTVEGSPLTGAFADADRSEAFSFDNLLALLAYTY